MRIVLAVDGDLLIPKNHTLGIHGQKDEITRLVEGLGDLIDNGHELVIVHGNAPQVGFVLLRSEMASHIVHPLPLDICGSDTQGATGYLLQQALRNWLWSHGRAKEVVTLVTQVLVDAVEPGSDTPKRGIGPYYDPEKARLYANARNWEFTLVSGRGYRRVVPSLAPKEVVERQSIKNLLACNTVVICAGGGGIPVRLDDYGCLQGVEAVVDKSLTVQLIARDIEADAIVFITQQLYVEALLEGSPGSSPARLELDQVQAFINSRPQLDDDLKNKLAAGSRFLTGDGKYTLITAPGFLRFDAEECGGLLITKSPKLSNRKEIKE